MYKKERREGVILMVQVSLLGFGDGCGSQLAEWGVYRLNAGLAVQFVIKFSPNHIAKSIILLPIYSYNFSSFSTEFARFNQRLLFPSALQ